MSEVSGSDELHRALDEYHRAIVATERRVGDGPIAMASSVKAEADARGKVLKLFNTKPAADVLDIVRSAMRSGAYNAEGVDYDTEHGAESYASEIEALMDRRLEAQARAVETAKEDAYSRGYWDGVRMYRRSPRRERTAAGRLLEQADDIMKRVAALENARGIAKDARRWRTALRDAETEEGEGE